MNSLRVVYHLAHADFLERVRRYSFLIVLAATLFTCYQVHTGQIGVYLSGYRGTMNSAWLGAVMTLTATTLLGLAGFYIVNNCIALDEQSHVGQLLAAMPVSRLQYICGKALSSFCLLSVIIFVLMLTAAPLQLLAGEDRGIRLGVLLGPFVLISLPVMALVAALAIFSETVQWLRGAVGNLLFFFLMIALLTLGFLGRIEDLTGLKYFETSMESAARNQLAKFDGHSFSFSIGMAGAPRGFVWNGLDVSSQLIVGRLEWLAIALGICGLATLAFNRFEGGRLREAVAKLPGHDRLANHRAGVNPGVWRRVTSRAHTLLPPLTSMRSGFPAANLFLSELSILLKGLPWWWHLGLLGCIVAGLTMPAAEFRQVLWVAWIWPLRVWSHMGNRESVFGTEEIVFSAPRPLLRQLPMTWLAGFAVAVLASGGVWVRMAASGNWTGVEQVFAGAVFVSSLALGLGVSTGGSKLFEALYTALWYIGPLNHNAALDYSQIAGDGNRSAIWLAASGCLLLVAAAARAMRLRG